MSHFLLERERARGETIGKRRAMVKVRVRGKGKDVSLEVQTDGIGVAKSDAQLSPLPDRVKVVDVDGKVVTPSHGSSFWVTSETIDPFHGVIEIPDDWQFFR